MIDPTQERVRMVRVKNNLDFPFNDRFNGVPVTIPPGQSEKLPLDMAAHFFGYHPGVEPAVMLRHIARRQGWNTPDYVKQNPETHQTLAEEYFSKLQISPIMYKMVEEQVVDPRAPIPAEQVMAEDEPVKEHWKTRQKREREEAARTVPDQA